MAQVTNFFAGANSGEGFQRIFQNSREERTGQGVGA